MADPALPQPKGVFWWGFYERPSLEEFLAAALTYLSGGGLDPRNFPSTLAQAHLVAGLLCNGRYLIILDGLENLQRQEGDRYGLLTSADFRDFLGYVAGPSHESFCLLTSRAPLLDLLSYPAYTHREVERLSPGDGRDLLRRLGVTGPDTDLDRLVSNWDGHALTLSLLASYLNDRHGGDVSHVGEIPPPTATEPRYNRVHRILRRYDENLGEPERTFLALFSAFRLPVPEVALKPVFRTKKKKDPRAFNSPLTRLNDASFQTLLQGLMVRRLLRFDPQARQYSVHPLIRAHYQKRLQVGPPTQINKIYRQIKEFYLSVAGEDKPHPTMEDLVPFIEAVHHACCSGGYDEGAEIYQKHINRGRNQALTACLGAYETDLSIMLEFFVNGDLTRDPQVSNHHARGFILNEVGICLDSLGRLWEGQSFYELGKDIALSREDWQSASIAYFNLAQLHEKLGELSNGAIAIAEALGFARKARSKFDECSSLATQGWLAHQRGDLQNAEAAFRQAEALQRDLDPSKRYLYSYRGIQHADHLLGVGEPGYALSVTEANRKICEKGPWPGDLSRCHRLLGNLEDAASRAREHYQESLQLARSISRRDILIEELLARGRWLARQGDASAAFQDLEEALSYAVAGGYRIYEADIRVGLAWANLAEGDTHASQTEAERVQAMSAEMGYHWGQLDAAEILAKLP